ncbi:hypothetical protein F5X68DRAFT_207357 [Plectosphaerella plurivora]|uniref:SMP-30/Gluconolactonase/LRE-like region domain-containing protein n=1 Tax=Plectosphaerella plurivora TaxID=936078 RepID=A0A9P8VBA5_9PEZI|nr:hypothetical protein F5X68DRAFT_207357 [Plectosphaerella plurivora]
MSALQQWTAGEPYINLHCGLAEGPYYEKETNSLRFVDIKKKRVHTVDLSEGPESVKTIQLDVPIGVTADIEGVSPTEKILVGLKYGVAVLDRKTGAYEYIGKVNDTDNDRLRGNDGAVDPNGRFWFGTMTDFGLGDFQPEGALTLFAGKAAPQKVLQQLTIPNGLGWSPDLKTMYFTHSTERTIYAFDYDVSTGVFENQRKFYVHDGPGEPDGFRVDAEGNLWHAVYGESRVLKISPAGELVGEVRLPTTNITCVQFVGTELFITTAGLDEGKGTEEQREYGGAVFKVDVGARGLDVWEFKL